MKYIQIHGKFYKTLEPNDIDPKKWYAFGNNSDFGWYAVYETKHEAVKYIDAKISRNGKGHYSTEGNRNYIHIVTGAVALKENFTDWVIDIESDEEREIGVNDILYCVCGHMGVGHDKDDDHCYHKVTVGGKVTEECHCKKYVEETPKFKLVEVSNGLFQKVVNK